MQVGQKLWFDSKARYVKAGEVSITKVGRKWAELDNGHRMNIETFEVDGRGYSSPGRCYWSRELCERETARQAEWRLFMKDIESCWSPPRSLTLEDIKRLRSEIGRS